MHCRIQKDTEKHRQTYALRIAASDFYTAYFISNLLSEMLEQYPDLHYTLWIGQEEELLHYFETKKTDVMIVSSDTEYSGHPFRYISFEVSSLNLSSGGVILTPLTAYTQKRKIFWQNGSSHPLIAEFVRRFCQVHV
ncbi:hypothetical protein DW757_11960 [Clostridium sp. AM29-11AC]|nr:hypothetical protein DW757_11960 [Clostridium sp. AM29-11AC]